MNDSEQPGARQSGPAGSGETASVPSAPASRRRARPNKFWRFVKWTFAVGFCLVLVLGGTFAGLLMKNKRVRDGFSDISIPGLVKGDPFENYTPAKYFPDHPHTLNLMILGCDTDYVGKRVNGYAIPVPVKNTNGRSDAILIAHYDFDKQTISVLTIPRDTAVHVPDHSTHKINAAHQFGGPALTQATIKEGFGIDTDAYVTLHFEAFQKIVDTVGGVDINVKKQLDYDDNWANLHIHLKPGLQHLTGYQAMGYVRIRHSDSDLMRAERQHDFMEALRKQVSSPKILTKVSDLLNAITDNLHSDLTTQQMITLANWSKKLPKENVVLSTMPSIEGPSYITCNRKPTRKMVAQIFFNGNEDAVTITTPDKEGLYASNRRGSHRKGRTHNRETSTDSGSDEPINDTPSAPDTHDTPSHESKNDKPDSSGSEAKSDGGSEQKSNDSGDKGKDAPPPQSPASAVAQLAALSFA